MFSSSDASALQSQLWDQSRAEKKQNGGRTRAERARTNFLTCTNFISVNPATQSRHTSKQLLREPHVQVCWGITLDHRIWIRSFLLSFGGSFRSLLLRWHALQNHRAPLVLFSHTHFPLSSLCSTKYTTKTNFNPSFCSFPGFKLLRR